VTNIRNFGARICALALAALGLSLSAHAQASLSSTTLSVAISSTSQQVVQLANASGVVANVTGLFIDKEYMPVEFVNGNFVTVIRGQFGTRRSLHASGAVVYLGPANYFSDYDRAGSCTAANETVLPVFNVGDGFGFDCRSSGQWIQTFNGTTASGAQESVRAFCTGVVGSNQTEYLNGAACSGATSATARYVAPQVGTIANLRVYSSANVVGGSSLDVLTVYKNGSATALTCTIAASAATCSDVTHSVSVAAGDVLTFQFVTATSDTAANVSVAIEKF
jgi:hypothetical protein